MRPIALLLPSLALSGLMLAAAAVPQVAGPVQVTATGGTQPTVSPDGLWVAYTYPGGGIARVPAGGGDPDTLCTFGREPDWAHTGNLVVFRYQTSLYTVDAVTKVTTLIRTGGIDDDPDWSPDMSEIVVQCASPDGLVVVAYPGGVITSIPCVEPNLSACSGETPTWSPDGQWIAFYGGPLLKVGRAGGAAIAVTQTGGYYPHWSPDGQWIAFSKQSEAGSDGSHVWVTDARGDAYGLWQVTSGPSENLRPAWGADSSALYFQSDRSGRPEIWKIEFHATAVERTSWGRLKVLYR